MAIAWGKCKIDLGLLGSGDALPDELRDVGKILNKSAAVSFEDGEERELLSEGGEVEDVDADEAKGTVVYGVICKDVAAYAAAYGLSTTTDELGRESFVQKTTLIEGHYFLRITPKKAGAVGYEVYKAVGRINPRWDTSEGWILDFTWKMMFNADGNLARPFEHSGARIELNVYEHITGSAQDTVTVTPTSAGKWKATTTDTWLTLDADTGDSGVGCVITIDANTGTQRTGTVKFTDGLSSKYFTVKQASGE